MNEDGKVKVEIVVDKSGRVVNAHAVNDAKRLQQVSERAAEEWEFSKLEKKSISKCGDRKTFVLFNYILLSGGDNSGERSRSFFVFPNKVEIRKIKQNVITNPAVDPKTRFSTEDN